jgi:hypothetical protein
MSDGKTTPDYSWVDRPLRWRAPIAIGLSLLGATLFAASSPNWPGFRGPNASGVVDGQNLPASWNVATGENIRWGAIIPGLAHSSPIVWGDRLYVTTAISSRTDASFKPGLYGEGTASEDRSEHRWVLLAIDRGAELPEGSTTPAIVGNRERAQAFARALERS